MAHVAGFGQHRPNHDERLVKSPGCRHGDLMPNDRSLLANASQYPVSASTILGVQISR